MLKAGKTEDWKGMKKKNKQELTSAPDSSALTEDRKEPKTKKRTRFWMILRSVILSLVVLISLIALVVTLWLPVLHIYENSMDPTLKEDETIIAWKTSEFKKGDIIAFYFNNKVLLKRIIAGPGDWVDMNDDGTVIVNGEALDEPYVTEKSRGDTNIEFPYQVPEDRWFVMGDHRSVSLDSRNQIIGSVANEQIIGKLVLKIWPPSEIGFVE